MFQPVSLRAKIISNGLFMTSSNLEIVNQSTDYHEFEEKDKSTNRFGTNIVLAYGRTCKAITPPFAAL